MDEKSLVKNLKSGDKTFLATLYKQYREEFIRWLIRKYDCSPEDAMDVYQLSVLAFYENVLNNKFDDPKSSVKTYLFSIGKNKFFDLKKKMHVFSSLEDRAINVAEDEDDDEKERLIRIAEKCLKELGDACQNIIKMYYYYNCSMEEISEKLGYKNVNTATNLKYKCMLKLKKIFEGNYRLNAN